jgi:hypothetical protein
MLAMGPLAWRSVLVLVLAAGAFAQLLLPRNLPLPAPPVPAVLATPEGGGETSPRTVYAAIAEHPLFDPTRRPYVAPKAPEPATTSERAVLRNYTLLGVVIGDGTRIAILKPPANGKTLTATEGQAIDGWTLRRITPRRVRFENGVTHYDMRFTGLPWLER